MLSHSLLPKKIISILIKSIYTSIIIPVEFVCDRVSSPIESIFVESIKNSAPYNVISDSAYLLALNFFIMEIGKDILIIRN